MRTFESERAKHRRRKVGAGVAVALPAPTLLPHRSPQEAIECGREKNTYVHW